MSRAAHCSQCGQNAPNVDLINSASVSAYPTQPSMTLSELPSSQKSTSTHPSSGRKGASHVRKRRTSETSDDLIFAPSRSRKDTTLVKKRRKSITVKELLNARDRGEDEQVSFS